MPDELSTRLPSIDVSYNRLLKLSNPERRAKAAMELLRRVDDKRRASYAARDRAIVEMHMVDGLSYTMIGDRLGMSREAVHKVVRAAVGPRKSGRPRRIAA